MATVDILVEGYVVQENESQRASSTAVLVREKGVNIIVDPGLARQPLAEALQKANLKPEDIQYVFLTHYHPDHALGAAWFPRAKILDKDEVIDGDLISQHDGFIPGTEIAIMHTSGHTPEHCSLAVPADQGMVVVAGDVFWWSDGENQTLDVSRPDPYANNQKLLTESRNKLLKLADFIIPGHGKIIKVK